MENLNKNDTSGQPAPVKPALTEQQARDLINKATANINGLQSSDSGTRSPFDSVKEDAADRVETRKANRFYFITIGVILSSIILAVLLDSIVLFGIVHTFVSMPLALITDRKWPKDSWKRSEWSLAFDFAPGLGLFTWLGSLLLLALAFFVFAR